MMEFPSVRRINVLSKQLHKSKCFILMEIYYKILHIFFFLDLGFFEHKSLSKRIFWKSITVILFMIFAYVSFLTLDIPSTIFHRQFNYYSIMLYYFCNVLGLALMNPSKTLHRFFFDLQLIDIMMRTDNSSYNLEIKVLLVSFLYCLGKVLVDVIYCAFVGMLSGIWIVINVISTSLNLVLISYSFVFYSINCRLKKFVSIFKQTDSDFLTLKLIYKGIIELADGYKNAFDPLFIFAVMFHVPHIMETILDALTFLYDTSNGASDGFKINYFLAAESLLFLVTPALTASLLLTQAHQLRVIMHNKLSHVQDEFIIEDIARFIRYVEARGCRYRVFEVIPFDASLLGSVIDFCVTYVIVILQFQMKTS